MMPFIISNGVVSLVHNNKPYTIDKSHINHTAIMDALRANDESALESLLDITISLKKYDLNNDLVIDVANNTIAYKQYPLNSVLVTRLLDLYNGGFNLTPLLSFIDNLYLNPSYKTINELYSFLEVGKLPITEDGHFLAYKKVNADYTSIHDGKTKNDIGTIVKMDRSLVDDNSSNTCSSGLHFCSFDYLEHFGDSTSKTIIVKVNPRHVCSIPTDHMNTKGRACEYLIHSEVGKKDIIKDSPVLVTKEYVDTRIVNTHADQSTISHDEHGYSTGYYDGERGNPKSAGVTLVSYHLGYMDGLEVYNKTTTTTTKQKVLAGPNKNAGRNNPSYMSGWYDGMNGRLDGASYTANLDKDAYNDGWKDGNAAISGMGNIFGKNKQKEVVAPVADDIATPYDAGWKDGFFHLEKYTSNKPIYSLADYERGYNEGVAGYAETPPKDPQQLGLPQVTSIPTRHGLVSAVKQEEVSAYNDGWKDGYHKRGTINRQIHEAYGAYYDMGHKDGRGHKTRRKFDIVSPTKDADKPVNLKYPSNIAELPENDTNALNEYILNYFGVDLSKLTEDDANSFVARVMRYMDGFQSALPDINEPVQYELSAPTAVTAELLASKTTEYNAGYKDGYNKKDRKLSSNQAYYDWGYKDGKGHKPRRKFAAE